MPEQGWHFLNLQGKIEASLQTSVVTDTDINFSVLGEFRSLLKQEPNCFVYLTIGTGIGGGIIIEGKIAYSDRGGASSGKSLRISEYFIIIIFFILHVKFQVLIYKGMFFMLLHGFMVLGLNSLRLVVLGAGYPVNIVTLLNTAYFVALFVLLTWTFMFFIYGL